MDSWLYWFFFWDLIAKKKSHGKKGIRETPCALMTSRKQHLVVTRQGQINTYPWKIRSLKPIFSDSPQFPQLYHFPTVNLFWIHQWFKLIIRWKAFFLNLFIICSDHSFSSCISSQIFLPSSSTQIYTLSFSLIRKQTSN